MHANRHGPSNPGTVFCLFLPPDILVRVSRQPLQGPWLHRPVSHANPPSDPWKEPARACGVGRGEKPNSLTWRKPTGAQ